MNIDVNDYKDNNDNDVEEVELNIPKRLVFFFSRLREKEKNPYL